MVRMNIREIRIKAIMKRLNQLDKIGEGLSNEALILQERLDTLFGENIR